jgi:hypothetical protein
MFQWLNKQGVEKAGEFFVQRADRFHYEYGEDGKSIKIVTEQGSGLEEIFVSVAVGPLDKPEGKRICENIAEALKFMMFRF